VRALDDVLAMHEMAAEAPGAFRRAEERPARRVSVAKETTQGVTVEPGDIANEASVEFFKGLAREQAQPPAPTVVKRKPGRPRKERPSEEDEYDHSDARRRIADQVDQEREKRRGALPAAL
jgi:hypothetical protein